MLAATACLFVLALAASALWLRGQPGTGHPLCRRCRFDLIGLDPVTTCPECGADLRSRSRAIRHDRRRHPTRLLIAATLLLATSAGLSIPPALALARSVNWDHHKPTWWLLRETRSTSYPRVSAALNQLLRRFDDGKIDDDTVLRLATKAIDYRDNGAPCGHWPLEFGNFVDLAWERNLLTEQQKLHYAVNAAGVWWSGPSYRKFPGAPTNPFLGVYPTLYVGVHTRSKSTFRPIDFEVHAISASLDGKPLTSDLRVSQSRPGEDVTHATAIVELPDDWSGREFRIAWHIQIVDFTSREPIGDPWLGSRTFTLENTIRFDGARRQDDAAPPQY